MFLKVTQMDIFTKQKKRKMRLLNNNNNTVIIKNRMISQLYGVVY